MLKENIPGCAMRLEIFVWGSSDRKDFSMVHLELLVIAPDSRQAMLVVLSRTPEGETLAQAWCTMCMYFCACHFCMEVVGQCPSRRC